MSLCRPVYLLVCGASEGVFSAATAALLVRAPAL
jgi:hypothetical protein